MNPIRIAKAENFQYILPKMANRHGLIAGATGTGKTVTLQTLAEGFSNIGVPVFILIWLTIHFKVVEFKKHDAEIAK
jgi:superfamily II DNA or RNA helicase